MTGGIRYLKSDDDQEMWCLECTINGRHPIVSDREAHDRWHAEGRPGYQLELGKKCDESESESQ